MGTVVHLAVRRNWVSEQLNQGPTMWFDIHPKYGLALIHSRDFLFAAIVSDLNLNIEVQAFGGLSGIKNRWLGLW